MQPLHNTPGRGRSSLGPATGSTAVLCKCCEGISIPSLVRLARTEFEEYQSFPQEAFYEHHATFSDLETSAVEGCVLCDLVLECFKGAPVEDDIRGPSWPEEWISEVDRDLDASMYGVAKSLPDSTVRVAISADHIYANASIKDVTEFDTLLFQVGPPDEDPEADMYWLLHPLALTLTISRGTHGSSRDCSGPKSQDNSFSLLISPCRRLHDQDRWVSNRTIRNYPRPFSCREL